ncbi:MAG: hypothetical protein ATN35_10630 [Epulopiscium sp. Nele67-Bin004]|nr:MAG: hypothetical protein ATN35_10630 [Epulopiscium sp. Nele67-Bin004]
MDNAIDYSNWKTEIIDGKIYYMSLPSMKHNRIMGRLFSLFDSYLRGSNCGVFIELGVHLDADNPTDYVVPDVSIICNQKVQDFEDFRGIPSLVIEILSTNRSNDKIVKFQKYQQFGIKEYWIIDPKINTIEQYTLIESKYVLTNIFSLLTNSELDKLSDTDRLQYTTIIQPTIFSDLNIDLTDIFE